MESLIYWFNQQNKEWEEMEQLQRVCPCCRDVVLDILYTKKSIFDIEVTICNACAREEGYFKKIGFNWIKETQSNIRKYNYKGEVLGL